MPDIISEEIVFKDKLIVEKAVIRDEKGSNYERLRINRQDAAAILLFNTDTRKVILTRQFRYPVSAHSSEEILEIVAGKVDEGEGPEETAIREIEEETGYRVGTEQLHLLTSGFSSPGYSTERLYIYAAHVTNADKISDGGGLAAEHEKIELVEMDPELFLKQIRSGEIGDIKTTLAGMLWVVR